VGGRRLDRPDGRIVASELEAELKQKFIVVNQPGASGSIGTKNAVEAPKDGYTWAAGARDRRRHLPRAGPAR
jgi:hypothetical protein